MPDDSLYNRWVWLNTLVEENPELYGGTTVFLPDYGQDYFIVQETFDDELIMHYERHLNGTRFTRQDLTGFIGLSSIDFTNRTLRIVEGVSDFISAKWFYKDNVLGKTTPKLSKKQLNVIKVVFDEVILLFDNDTAGMKALTQVSSDLRKAGLRVKIQLPDSLYKDITQELYNKCWLQQKDQKHLKN